ncbi:MAG: carbohydrate-binding protein [Thermoplasmata archaeon]
MNFVGEESVYGGMKATYRTSLTPFQEGITVQYCACVYTPTESKWLNNDGANYHFQVVSPQNQITFLGTSHTPEIPFYYQNVTITTTVLTNLTANAYLVWTYDNWKTVNEELMVLSSISGSLKTFKLQKPPLPGGTVMHYCIKVKAWIYTAWDNNNGSNYSILFAGESSTVETTQTLRSVCWSSDGKYALLVGAAGTVRFYDGYRGIYSKVYSGTTSTLHSAEFQPISNATLQARRALIVGASGTVLKWDGAYLTKIPGASGTLYKLAWEPSGQYALIVGSSGGVYKYEGGSITKIQSGTTSTFYSVAFHSSGYALIVGSSGKIYKYNGRNLTKLDSPVTTTLYDVAFKPNTNIATIVGSSGKVLKYNNGNITSLSSGTTKTLYAVNYRQLGDYACIVGSYATILKYDGVSFSTVAKPGGISTQTLYDVSFRGNSNPFVVGTSGKNALAPLLKEVPNKVGSGSNCVDVYYYPQIKQLVIRIEETSSYLHGEYTKVHVGFNNWAWLQSTDSELIKIAESFDGSNYTKLALINIPSSATSVNFCFHDGAGNWANNNGNNWNVQLASLTPSDVDYGKTRIFGKIKNYSMPFHASGTIWVYDIGAGNMYEGCALIQYSLNFDGNIYRYLIGEASERAQIYKPIFPGTYVLMLEHYKLKTVSVSPGYNYIELDMSS